LVLEEKRKLEAGNNPAGQIADDLTKKLTMGEG